jgi:lipoate-protein ligase B
MSVPVARSAAPPLEHQALGVRGYDEVLALQRSHRKLLLDGGGHDLLLSVEHRPGVLTAGRRARADELRVGEDTLSELGVQIRTIERGGSWTWHGPGQLVAYPIVSLRRWQLKVPAFVAGLEWAMAQLLEGILDDAGIDREARGLRVGQLRGYPGTWVQRADGSVAKVGAVGIHVRRFVSLHGLAFNLDPDPWGFEWIVPCGLEGVETTSAALLIAELGGKLGTLPSVSAAAERLALLLPSCWQPLEEHQGPVCLGSSPRLTR